MTSGICGIGYPTWIMNWTECARPPELHKLLEDLFPAVVPGEVVIREEIEVDIVCAVVLPQGLRPAVPAIGHTHFPPCTLMIEQKLQLKGSRGWYRSCEFVVTKRFRCFRSITVSAGSTDRVCSPGNHRPVRAGPHRHPEDVPQVSSDLRPFTHVTPRSIQFLNSGCDGAGTANACR